jgi:hypothetical protein
MINRLTLLLFIGLVLNGCDNRINKTPSIAILPLENRGDVEDDFLADSITENVILELNELKNSLQLELNVSELDTVKKYINSELSLEDLANDIGVDYIFLSSVQPNTNGYIFRVKLYSNKLLEYSKKEGDVFINKWTIERKNIQSVVGIFVEDILQGLELIPDRVTKPVDIHSSSKPKTITCKTCGIIYEGSTLQFGKYCSQVCCRAYEGMSSECG